MDTLESSTTLKTAAPSFHAAFLKHAAIGIDIDETLINGPGSRMLQEWVMEYHSKVDLHLVTFRAGAHYELIGEDVFRWGITRDMFKGIHGIPVEVGVPFWNMIQRVGERGPNLKKWERTLAHHKIDQAEYDRLELEVAMWKGAKCKELGLTALVDDLERWVVPGCNAHGVTWFNSLDLHSL